MLSSKQTYLTLLILSLLLVTSVVQCQDDDEDEFHDRTPKGGFVDVDVHEGDKGKHVGVHVPVFYKMDLDKDEYNGRKGLGINVLEGLVKVRVKKDPYAMRDRNVFVSVAGIPFWNSRK